MQSFLKGCQSKRAAKPFESVFEQMRIKESKKEFYEKLKKNSPFLYYNENWHTCQDFIFMSFPFSGRRHCFCPSVSLSVTNGVSAL